MNRITKTTKASQGYGRGQDNYRQPAIYAVSSPEGVRFAVIMGTRAGYRQGSRWSVYRVFGEGVYRLAFEARSFKEAKAKAEGMEVIPSESAAAVKNLQAQAEMLISIAAREAQGQGAEATRLQLVHARAALRGLLTAGAVLPVDLAAAGGPYAVEAWAAFQQAEALRAAWAGGAR